MLKANYHVESWSERYYGTEEVKDESTQEIDCATLMDVLSVTFTPPSDREDPECFIYGEISVKIGPSDASVTLFHRERQDAACIVLKDDSKNFLTLPDLPGGFSPLPLKADPERNLVRVTMALSERKSSKEEDVVIADVEDFVHVSHAVGICSYFEFRGESKFRFGVGLCATLGSPVLIEVRLKEEEAPLKSINAEIQVIQNVNYCDGTCCCGQAVRTLYNNSEQVPAGSKLKLLRNIVCLPMEHQQFLTILIRPDRDDKDKCKLVDFPFELVPPSLRTNQQRSRSLRKRSGRSFRTNQQGILTKDVPETPFSVSIKFLDQSC